MQYQTFRADGFIIGSGSVESGIKQYKARLTGAGMRWSRAGVERMVSIRSAILSSYFCSFWGGCLIPAPKSRMHRGAQCDELEQRSNFAHLCNLRPRTKARIGRPGKVTQGRYQYSSDHAYVGRDPEMAALTAGVPVCDSLASQRGRWTDATPRRSAKNYVAASAGGSAASGYQYCTRERFMGPGRDSVRHYPVGHPPMMWRHRAKSSSRGLARGDTMRAKGRKPRHDLTTAERGAIRDLGRKGVRCRGGLESIS